MLAPSGTHAWCLGTSAWSPWGRVERGRAPAPSWEAVEVMGWHQDFCGGCCWGRSG